jgi:hypothetical protein
MGRVVKQQAQGATGALAQHLLRRPELPLGHSPDVHVQHLFTRRGVPVERPGGHAAHPRHAVRLAVQVLGAVGRQEGAHADSIGLLKRCQEAVRNVRDRRAQGIRGSQVQHLETRIGHERFASTTAYNRKETQN